MDNIFDYEGRDRRPMNEKELKLFDAESSLDEYRYDFSQKASRNEIKIEDLFAYVKMWAAYYKSFYDAIGYEEGSFQYDGLLRDCASGKLTHAIVEEVNDRKEWVEFRIEANKLFDNQRAQDRLFRNEDYSYSEKIVNATDEKFLSQNLWMPYEIQGLQKCIEIAQKTPLDNT